MQGGISMSQNFSTTICPNCGHAYATGPLMCCPNCGNAEPKHPWMSGQVVFGLCVVGVFAIVIVLLALLYGHL